MWPFTEHQALKGYCAQGEWFQLMNGPNVSTIRNSSSIDANLKLITSGLWVFSYHVIEYMSMVRLEILLSGG